MATAKILIELEVKGDPHDVIDVVDELLEAGRVQDMITDEAGDEDCRDELVPVEIVNASARFADRDIENAAALQDLKRILWPDDNPDAEHNADTLGAIANRLDFLKPEPRF